MPRYFFDVYDGAISRDDEGQELPDLTAVRKSVMRSLPRIAAEEIAEGTGDKRYFIVVVRDELGGNVYTATLSYVGLALLDPAAPMEIPRI